MLSRSMRWSKVNKAVWWCQGVWTELTSYKLTSINKLRSFFPVSEQQIPLTRSNIQLPKVLRQQYLTGSPLKQNICFTCSESEQRWPGTAGVLWPRKAGLSHTYSMAFSVNYREGLIIFDKIWPPPQKKLEIYIFWFIKYTYIYICFVLWLL